MHASDRPMPTLIKNEPEKESRLITMIENDQMLNMWQTWAHVTMNFKNGNIFTGDFLELELLFKWKWINKCGSKEVEAVGDHVVFASQQPPRGKVFGCGCGHWEAHAVRDSGD